MKLLQGRSVFLTGHTGFKGAWLALWLHRLGASVHGFALAPRTPGLFEEARIADLLASHTVGDVRDFAALHGAIKRARPEIVFHLAAQSLVGIGHREPRETFEINTMGAVNLLEAVRQLGGVRACQIITSDKCYENREWVYAYRESDPMGGADPYSASKGCAELVVTAYRRSFFPTEQLAEHGTSLASARAGNVIGGGDWAEDRIIPDCIRALEKGESIVVRNPAAIRPWQHVLEPLAGYLTLATRQMQGGAEFADAFNFGPATFGHVPVKEIVQRVIAIWGGGNWHAAQLHRAPQPHEAHFLKLDVTKATNLLSWKPVYGIDTAISQTVRWYKERSARGRAFAARELCLAQIAEYEKLSPLVS
ncbi:MAG TPA: CDP-glucose 4,6-dehydratase [Phycisphaerae bacterium]|nr:CDP-glucose 4,6-dehydratase [Phycisphaerae bacterium]